MDKMEVRPIGKVECKDGEFKIALNHSQPSRFPTIARSRCSWWTAKTPPKSHPL